MSVQLMRDLNLLAGTALAAVSPNQYRSVRLAAGVLALAGAADTDALGILSQNVFDTVTPVLVLPYVNGQYTGLIMVASGAITAGVAVYADTNGKVSATGTVLRGVSYSAASADGDYLVVIPSAAAVLGAIARSALTTDTQPFAIPLTSVLTHATMVGLGSAAGTPAGDFGLTPGTHGTNTPKLIGEAANNNSKSDAGRFLFRLPECYLAAGTITVRVHGRITGNVQVAQTIAVACYASDSAAGVSASLCTTAAQTVTAAFADYDFVITPTGRAAGDVLDILVTGAANDTGGTANKLIEIGDIRVLLQIKG